MKNSFKSFFASKKLVSDNLKIGNIILKLLNIDSVFLTLVFFTNILFCLLMIS